MTQGPATDDLQDRRAEVEARFKVTDYYFKSVTWSILCVGLIAVVLKEAINFIKYHYAATTLVIISLFVLLRLFFITHKYFVKYLKQRYGQGTKSFLATEFSGALSAALAIGFAVLLAFGIVGMIYDALILQKGAASSAKSSR